MTSQDIAQSFIQQQRNKGRREGRDEGFAEAVLTFYTERFGPPPADVAMKLMATHDRDTLRSWLHLVATDSPQHVVAAIRAQAAS